MLGDAPPVDLETLEQRSALQRRVDRAAAERLAAALASDHDALEIGGERLFAYESAYFDTPQLGRLVPEAGVEEASLSKYRAGIALVVVPGEDAERAEERQRWFAVA